MNRKRFGRYSREAMHAHYDPDVDIALIVLQRGEAVSQEYDWGLIDRDPGDGHLIGFEIWNASGRLPPQLLDALPTPNSAAGAA
jgi:uncharacterized protein YuzE